MLKIGIVGLPNVGKSTLFNALTKKGVPMENYPFCTIDPSVGVVAVPDTRVAKLAEFSSSRKIVPAAIEFVDIAGLVRGASKGEGLGNQFLSHIREVDAIAHVVRCFDDSTIIHVDNKLDPESDIGVIKTELELADLDVVEKHKAKMKEKGKEEEKLNLLATKPVLYVLNVTHVGDNVLPNSGSGILSKNGNQVSVHVDATSGEDLDKLIKASYELLGLISYFTTGEDETRAWTIPAGSTAPEAGAAIHTDFRDKFIRAEVVAYDDLMKSGSYAKARELGLVRTEGKEYIVKDGDVIEFRI
ncbi:MAG: redox-regulated ATPase YchF [Patescibacteria group bacterium]